MFGKAFLQRLVPFLITTSLVGTLAQAQDKTREVDEIFSWVTPNSPGCAVGVSQHGQVLVNRAYGMADLERGTPLTPETVFDIGSVTKQFVAASVLLLVNEGRISLSDDIRKYVPELPDYGHKVTIDHLLTHTSGIRDWVWLSQVTGGREDVLTLILRQRGLNFAPGEEWSYSNSGYELLREVVARVSGQTLAEFMRARLFEPLEMTSTRYARDAREVPNHALAYEKEGGQWRVDMLLGNARGGGGVFSTTGDLLIWNDALTDNRLGAFVSEKIREPARLRNGRRIDYARGLFLDDDGEIVWHPGDAAAYNAILARLPKQGVSLALLCNAGEVADREDYEVDIIELFVPAPADSPAAPADADADVPTPDLGSRAGLFFSERTGDPLHLVVDDGRLLIAGGPPLVARGTDRFRNPRGALSFMSQDEFELHFVSQDQLELKSMEGRTTWYRRARPYAPSAADLAAFAGRYETDEIGAVEVSPTGNGLSGRLNGSPPIEFAPVDPDVFQAGPTTIRFRRDAAGKVISLDLNSPALRNAHFPQRSDGTNQPAPEASAVSPESDGTSADPEALVGFYEATPGQGITISLEDGTLYGEPTGQSKAQLVPQSGTTYFVGHEGAPVTVSFTVGTGGGATTLILRQGSGVERTFPKVR